MLFDLALFALGIVTGGVAAIVGFGIGSFLTPVLALKMGFDVSVAAVGIAHFFGSALRCWMLRHNVNRQMLLSFGMVSGVGGLVGAAVQSRTSIAALSIVFGALMVFAGVSGLLRWTEKVRLRGATSWIVGAASGFFGGLVGNQGGLRAAGLLGFNLKKAEFVATATATALLVDIFRMPVYVVSYPHQLVSIATQIAIMALGVAVGTLAGAPLLRRLPERHFRVVLSVMIIGVGALVVIGS